jgi:hypothetical protein
MMSNFQNKYLATAMTLLANHPERNIIRVQLKQNIVLKELRDSEMAALEPYLTVVNHARKATCC